MQPKKGRGFIHLHREEKEVIIDESAAYNFQCRIKQAVKLHCTASSDGVRPSMRWKHSYIHVLWFSLDVSPCFFSSSFSLAHIQPRTTHQGMRLNVFSTPFRTEYALVWDMRKSTDTISAPGGLPLGFILNVWLPTRETARL